MNWKCIFKDCVPSVAGVHVFDKGHADSIGRYVVAKTMKLLDGRTLTKQTDFFQRPAALRYANRFLTERAAKFNRTYTPGDGRNSIMGCQL